MKPFKRKDLLLIAIVGVSTTAIVGLYWAQANNLFPWNCRQGIIDHSYVSRTIGYLSYTSDIILMGTVERIGPSWTSSEGPINTNVDISISEYIKVPQTSASTVSLIALGGTIGCYTETWVGEPQFVRGEGVLVFLVQTADGHWRVTEGIQGKFTVSGGTASRPIDAAPLPLSDLLDEIRRNL